MKKSKIIKIVKKSLIVLVSIAIGIYFFGNVLVNLIGVPLAAYHSYEAWSEMGKHPSELMEEASMEESDSLSENAEEILNNTKKTDLEKEAEGPKAKEKSLDDTISSH